MKAIDVIDEIIHIIRHSENMDEAKAELIRRFDFTEIQATAIVEMRLRQLTGLEREKLQAEYDELEKFIARCQEILGSVEEQLKIVKAETLEIKSKYADPRRTEIRPSEEEFNPEDFYADEDVVITISHLGYIKRTPLTEYRTQARGGVGMKGSSTRDEDFIEHDKIKAYINVKTLKDEDYVNGHSIALVTKRGVIKKTALSAYSHPRAAGVNAVNLRDGDVLVEALLTGGDDEILIAAREGRCCRFNEKDAREMGRTSTGVRGINIEDDDEVIGAINYNPAAEDAQDHTVLVVSENGFGKRTDFDEYRITKRGGKGVKTINITEKTGKLIAIKNVTENDDLMIIEKSGLTIRMSVSDIRVAGRATQGVKLINIKEGDSIASLSTVAKNEENEENADSAVITENTDNTEN